MSELPMRRVRSFVRRDSRMTDAQEQAFKTQWSVFGLDLKNGLIAFDEVFNRQGAKQVIEIGFGSGTSLLAMASVHPEQNFIGIETHLPGIGALLLGMMAEQITNLRVYHADAVEVLTRCIPDNSLDVVQIFFPDPWPKRRHHKRRLIQTDFVNLLVKKLKREGELHLATDWKDYALHMMKVLSAIPELKNTMGVGCYANRSAQRPVITKFEKRGEQSGHETWELQFSKIVTTL